MQIPEKLSQPMNPRKTNFQVKCLEKFSKYSN